MISVRIGVQCKISIASRHLLHVFGHQERMHRQHCFVGQTMMNLELDFRRKKIVDGPGGQQMPGLTQSQLSRIPGNDDFTDDFDGQGTLGFGNTIDVILAFSLDVGLAKLTGSESLKQIPGE